LTGTIIWLTGIPSSGKTTIGKKIAEKINAIVLDGDVLRSEYPEHQALGFDPEDRKTNVLLTSKKAKKYAEAGENVVIALVSPNRNVRQEAKKIHNGPFVMIHVDCPPNVCADRDPKGNWALARMGKIKNFTGYSAPYDIPLEPDLVLQTHELSVDECVDRAIEAYEEASRVQLYIGRWQPFHNGHKAIIDEVIGENRNVVIGIRDTPLSDTNPMSFEERKCMIEEVYIDEPLVSVYPYPFPNINSINIGRKVGYDIRTIEVDVPVSGTDIRQKKNIGDESWKKDVPL
jgi:adenylylsulfate kinase